MKYKGIALTISIIYSIKKNIKDQDCQNSKRIKIENQQLNFLIRETRTLTAYIK